jgi:two-component system, NarL family, invasion response regulator UvrY
VSGSVAVMVVDDHAACRRVIRDVVDITDGFEPAGEAASGPEAISIAETVRPDLILMDLRMPGLDGCETARRISTSHPEATIVLVTMQDPHELGFTAESCGAVALLPKSQIGPEFLRDVWGRHGARETRVG